MLEVGGRPRYYKLDDKGDPVPCASVREWGDWYEKADRRLALDHVGKTTVSTVFLGLDHACSGGPPVLWETLVFPDEEGEMRRYTSRAEAIEGHRAMLEDVKRRQTLIGQFLRFVSREVRLRD